MKRRYPHKERILLVNITRLGDMLQATPTIHGMKLENPNAKITVLVEKQFEDICFSMPDIDEVIGLDLGMTVRSLAREQDGIIDAYEYISEVVDKLRAGNFDYVLNMSSSAYTALLLRLVNVPRQGGWTSDAEGFRIIESEWARLFASSVFHQNRQFNSLNLVDIFRCSADVEQHPDKLMLSIQPDADAYSENLLNDFGFTNTGPLVAVQAGASQEKRQWAPEKFSHFINILTEKHNARVVMSGSNKELDIIQDIVSRCDRDNVKVAAGKTNIPQLAALLSRVDLLVTGDTGPMHVSVAVGTPVIAMFLASAYGFETGPYSQGNIVLQPVIGCGPCNPNKPCARPDCHDTIAPELLAELTVMRLKGDVTQVDKSLADPRLVTVYRSFFDEFGFCDLQQINGDGARPGVEERYRAAYRTLWLEDLGGLKPATPSRRTPALNVVSSEDEAITSVVTCAEQGVELINRLKDLINDLSSPASLLSDVTAAMGELDREIENLGYYHQPLCPLTKMFVFAKENLQGTDPLDLASQMERVYADLVRRGRRLSQLACGATLESGMKL